MSSSALSRDRGRSRVVAVNASVNGVADASRGVDDRLVWIDLEMTGLDVERQRIVEIAVLVTDSKLDVLADGLDLVVHQPPEVLAEMDDFVRKMHTKSGLLPEIERSSITLEAAGDQAIEYIRQLVPEPGAAPMCGNSIGVDRRFLDRYLPELDRYLHYRSIDVSSLKELCRRWYPAVYKKRPSKTEKHRALDDIRESVAELRYYRDTIMQPPAPAQTPPEQKTSP
jgi:oligoribonuclease